MIPSYRNLRPFLTVAELGSWSGIVPIMLMVDARTTAIELTNRFSTYTRSTASSSATPVGASPTSRASGVARSGPKMHEPDAQEASTRNSFLEPMAVRKARVPEAFQTIIPGWERLASRSAMLVAGSLGGLVGGVRWDRAHAMVNGCV